MARRGRRFLSALALAALLASCTVPKDQQGREPDPDGNRERDRTDQQVEIDPNDGTIITRSDTTTPTGPDSRPADVPDRTFPGLGDPRIDVSSYDVAVRADPGKKEIRGRVVIKLQPVGPRDLPQFTLDLRGPKVTTTLVDGKVARTAVDGHQIIITPGKPVAAGRPHTVVIRYGGVPDQATFPALNIPVGWQPDEHGGWFTMSEPDGTSTWVPVSDHPSDKAVWKVSLDTPAGVTGVSNGRLLSHATKAGRTTWIWEEPQQMAPYLVLAAVGDFDLVQRTVGTRHDTFAFPKDLSAGKRASFDALDDILDYYAETFGPLPGSESHAGQNAGAIVVDFNLGVALETQTRPLFGTDSVRENDAGALAHELGHQWFGDNVSLADWPDLWLNEGFATYADWLYRDHSGKAKIDDIAEETAKEYANVGLTVRDPTAAGTFDLVVYNRGALTLHALRKTVGDTHFFQILRQWTSQYAGRSATTADFVALSSKVSGRNLTGFFHDWLDKAPQPKLPS